MGKDRKLSFIIPTYNCAEFIDETVGSVISQLPDDCELILVDDGSSDETPRRLREFGERYTGIRTAYIQHGGASSARNAGIDMAEGEWITFMDCDDCLKEGFFEKAMKILDDKTDLYTFSFERVEYEPSYDSPERTEIITSLTVDDRTYLNTSEYADHYIRDRALLVYSACNKFYRRSILNEHGIRFRDGMPFGEDRLFNYDYLMHCGQIRTSSIRMFDYIQRNPDSASNRYYPDYFNTIMTLHKAKMDCFLNLSKGTTNSEKRSFVGYDLSNEVRRMIDRFDAHPEEKEENLPFINRLLFGDTNEPDGSCDVIIVLGSSNCQYRIEKAYDFARNDEDTVFLVTGGNLHKDGKLSEARFMADYLRTKGVPEKRILVENQAENTFRNLELSAQMIDEAAKTGLLGKAPEDLRIGIVTAGFHMQRTKGMLMNIPWYEGKNMVFIPAFTDRGRPDSWYLDPNMKAICLGEIAKCVRI